MTPSKPRATNFDLAAAIAAALQQLSLTHERMSVSQLLAAYVASSLSASDTLRHVKANEEYIVAGRKAKDGKLIVLDVDGAIDPIATGAYVTHLNGALTYASLDGRYASEDSTERQIVTIERAVGLQVRGVKWIDSTGHLYYAVGVAGDGRPWGKFAEASRENELRVLTLVHGIEYGTPGTMVYDWFDQGKGAEVIHAMFNPGASPVWDEHLGRAVATYQQMAKDGENSADNVNRFAPANATEAGVPFRGAGAHPAAY